MLLTINNLSKSYGKKQVLEEVCLQIPENEIVGLLGSNGAGKSTLIKCINDLLCYEGSIQLDGREQQPALRSQIAYLPEKSCLKQTWKIRDAIRFFDAFYPDFDAEKAGRLISQMELDPDSEIKALSKGMQEKLQIALILSRKARLYILDEPLGGVDPATREKILDMILENFAPGSSMIVSTHLIADLERILDRALFMKEGKIMLDGAADDLRETHKKSIDALFREVYAC